MEGFKKVHTLPKLDGYLMLLIVRTFVKGFV